MLTEILACIFVRWYLFNTLIKRFPSMLIEEETKPVGDINPDALEAVLDEDVHVDEEVIIFTTNDGENDDADEIDIAFAANDEGYW